MAHAQFVGSRCPLPHAPRRAAALCGRAPVQAPSRQPCRSTRQHDGDHATAHAPDHLTHQTLPQTQPHHFQDGPHPHAAHHAIKPKAHARNTHHTRRDLLVSSFPSHSHVLPTPGGHSGVELYGNYRIVGPASIHKAGAGALVANLSPLAQVDALEGGTCDTLCCETWECDEEQPCSLVAEHVELQGNFLLVKDDGRVNPESMEGVHALGDKIVLTVRLLPEDTQIVLEAGGQLNHPVTVRHR